MESSNDINRGQQACRRTVRTMLRARLAGAANWIAGDLAANAMSQPLDNLIDEEPAGNIITQLTAVEAAKSFQFVITYATPEYWRVRFNNPPFKVFGPDSIPQLNSIITQIEEDPKLKVVVFESVIPGVFLTHYAFDQPLERHVLLQFYLGDAIAIEFTQLDLRTRGAT